MIGGALFAVIVLFILLWAVKGRRRTVNEHNHGRPPATKDIDIALKTSDPDILSKITLIFYL